MTAKTKTDVMLSPYAIETICFVAGTPVWTDKGLVPIEKLKVGDLVLSKSDVSGEKAYKRVLKTFRSENQEIRTINFVGPITEDGAESRREYLFATPGHPFWIKDRGWMTVDEIFEASEDYEQLMMIPGWNLERANGGAAEMGIPGWTVGFPLIQLLDSDNHAFLITDALNSDGEFGYTMRFDGQTRAEDFDPVDCHRVPGRQILFHGATRTGDEAVYRDQVIYPEDVTLFKTTVYNIEVEDFHTYFVGELGVWVHNTCAPILGRLASQYAGSFI